MGSARKLHSPIPESRTVRKGVRPLRRRKAQGLGGTAGKQTKIVPATSECDAALSVRDHETWQEGTRAPEDADRVHTAHVVEGRRGLSTLSPHTRQYDIITMQQII